MIRHRLVIVLLPVVILIHNTAHNAVFMRWNTLRMYEVPTLPDILMGPEKVSINTNTVRAIAFAAICACAALTAIRQRASASLVFYRFVCVYAIASVLRCATFFATLLPATATYCKSPKIGGTYNPDRAPKTIYEVMFRFDWTHSCGDLLFSGHTVLIMCAYLSTESLVKYACEVKVFDRFLLWLCRLLLLPFLVLTVYTRKHYTIDVGIAVLVTVLLWRVLKYTRFKQSEPLRAIVMMH